jgi:hypothetical protein
MLHIDFQSWAIHWMRYLSFLMTWLSSGREYSGKTAREEMRKARVPEKQGWEGFQRENVFIGLNSCLCHPNTSTPKYANQEQQTRPSFAIQRENML